MNALDFTPSNSEAQTLAMIDELVGHGLSRERADRIVSKIEATINGPFSEMLKTLAQADPTTPDAETAFIQTGFFAYLMQWVDGRALACQLAQTMALVRLVEIDGLPEADPKGGI